MLKILAFAFFLNGRGTDMDLMIKDAGDGGDVVMREPVQFQNAPHYQYSAESLTAFGGNKFARATTVRDWAVFAPRDADYVLAYDRMRDVIVQSSPHQQGDNAYWGATTVGDWAVFSPRNADKVAAFNPVTGILKFSEAYTGGDNPFVPVEITAVGGWAVFAPQSSEYIYAFNPETGVLKSLMHSEGLAAFAGCTAVGRWAVFGPAEALHAVAYDPVTDMIQQSPPHGSDAYSYNGATTVGDAAIFTPNNGSVLIYYPEVNTLVVRSGAPTSAAFLSATTVGKWAVFSPYGSSEIMAYNLATDTFKITSGEGIEYLGYSTATTVGEWAIFSPRNATRVRAYNPETGEVRRGDILVETGNAYWGVTTVGDWAVFSSYTATKILSYRPDNTLIPATTNADLYQDPGIGTAVYMSLFDAPGWMEGFKTAEEKVQSLGSLERAFNDPITRGSMARLKAIAESNLRWLTEDGVCSQIQIAVRNPELGYIEIDITATEPNDVRNRYKMLWNREEQKLVSFVRSPDRPNVILSP